MKRNHVVIIVALLLTTLILGCNTLKGVGRDVESVGDGIQDAIS
ncbi:entericidin A/B family lipoprotein [Candidatus Omnitrophota bacterium]